MKTTLLIRRIFLLVACYWRLRLVLGGLRANSEGTRHRNC